MKAIVELTKDELKDLWEALGDAGELIDEKIECGMKYDDYSADDIKDMRKYLARLEALAKRFAELLWPTMTDVLRSTLRAVKSEEKG